MSLECWSGPRQEGIDRPASFFLFFLSPHLSAGGADVDALAVFLAVAAAVHVVRHAAVLDDVVADLGSDHEVLQPHALVATGEKKNEKIPNRHKGKTRSNVVTKNVHHHREP